MIRSPIVRTPDQRESQRLHTDSMHEKFNKRFKRFNLISNVDLVVATRFMVLIQALPRRQRLCCAATMLTGLGSFKDAVLVFSKRANEVATKKAP